MNEKKNENIIPRFYPYNNRDNGREGLCTRLSKLGNSHAIKNKECFRD